MLEGAWAGSSSSDLVSSPSYTTLPHRSIARLLAVLMRREETWPGSYGGMDGGGKHLCACGTVCDRRALDGGLLQPPVEKGQPPHPQEWTWFIHFFKRQKWHFKERGESTVLERAAGTPVLSSPAFPSWEVTFTRAARGRQA